MLNHLLDKTSAKFPLKVALIFEDQTYTYADLPGSRKAWPPPYCSKESNRGIGLLSFCETAWK